MITRRHLVEAQAYYRLEPWGPERDGWHAAQITTAIFQVWTKRRLRIDSNLLKFVGESSKPKSLVNKLRSIAIAIVENQKAHEKRREMRGKRQDTKATTKKEGVK